MYREVSDLSFGSGSEGSQEGDNPLEASPQLSLSDVYEGERDSSWRTYTNDLDLEADDEDLEADNLVQDSAASSGAVPGMVRFNTTFETSQDTHQQSERLELPATWAASEQSDLAVIAAHLAAAALPPVKQSSSDQYAVLLPSPLTAEDMLGCGTLDLRSCTLSRRAATFAATQRLGTYASFSIPLLVFTACFFSCATCRAHAVPAYGVLACRAGYWQQRHGGQNIKRFQTWQLCRRAAASTGIAQWYVFLWRFKAETQVSWPQLLRPEEAGMATTASPHS